MNDSTFGIFQLHRLGYVRHWLVSGPRSTPFVGTIKDDDTFRYSAVNGPQVKSPKPAELRAEGPLGQPWRFHDPGQNYFVEYTDFWAAPAIVDLYAYTEIQASQEGDVEAHLWVAGAADLWLDGRHVTQVKVPRYMHPDYRPVTLPLQRGANGLCLRLQVAALRDTRYLFGLQLLGSSELSVQVPGAASFVAPIHWLSGVKAEMGDSVVSELPAPMAAEVVFPDGKWMAWPEKKNRVSFGAARPSQFDIKIKCEDQVLVRHMEIPANQTGLTDSPPSDIRQAHLDLIASAPDVGFFPGGEYCQLPLLTRRFLGRTSMLDAPSFSALTQYIKGRGDCSDFALAALLRLDQLGLATAAEKVEIKRTALDFRYWHDEPGDDAMCFGSENHSLLFHGCQLIAGLMYPDEVFSNTKRIGREQAAHGLRRTREWIEVAEARGLSEFLSSTYIPITVGALLNVVDFCGDVRLSQRAAALVDRIYENLADHAFDGLTVGPQGRVYRNVLFPEQSGTQALLSWARPEALFPRVRSGDWIIFLATSKNYRPPEGLGVRMRRPVSRRYLEAGGEIVLHRTPDYILTSLAVPPSVGQCGPRPGTAGYQELLWQATLGIGCHVFVNHPGCSFDGLEKLSRPGYWHGNGIVPVVRQREGVLQAIFNIPDGTQRAPDEAADVNPPFGLYPISFTHAHWPAHAFEEQKFEGQWVFGRKKTGFIGLWCSGQLEPHDEVLAGCELRAPGYRTAWTVICGGHTDHASFEAFIASCLSRVPEFDSQKLALRMKGEKLLQWPRAETALNAEGNRNNVR